MAEHLSVQESIRIPKERIAVLIGKKGEVRRMFEKKSGLKLRIDSKEGEVILFGDSISVFEFKEVINAIARGFAPENAFKLFELRYSFELVDIKDFGKTKNRVRVLRGRVVGTEGKARRNLECLTNCNIIVFGNTVGIIGREEDVLLAKEAVERILEGALHGRVYGWLEKRRKALREHGQ